MKHVIRLLDAIWSLVMGLYLGLTVGTVLAVILAFQTTRSPQVQARPGTMPYASPRFEEDWPGFVAGAIGNQLFKVAGVVALILVGLAVLAMLGRLAVAKTTGVNKPAWAVRVGAMFVVVGAMGLATNNVRSMNAAWPGLYDLAASEQQLIDRREAFEALHQKSERYVGTAWLAGALALVITPWCTPVKTD